MLDDDLRTRIERLEALEEIRLLKARYFRLLDLHLWDELRSLFTEDATFDIAESTSQPATRDAFLASVRRHLDGAVTVHHGHMPELEVLEPDRVRGTWAMQDLVEPAAGSPHPVLSGYGHYVEEYRKVDGRWRIASLQLTRLKRTTVAASGD